LQRPKSQTGSYGWFGNCQFEFPGMVERVLFQSSKLEIKIDLLSCWEKSDGNHLVAKK